MAKLGFISNRRIEVFAVLLIAVSLFTMLSLVTYNPLEEPTISEQVAIRNVMGILGVYASHYLIKFTLGYAAVIIPLLGMIWGVWILTRRNYLTLLRLSWYGLLLGLLTAITVGLMEAPRVYQGAGDFTASGLVGGLLAKVLHDFLGLSGSLVLLLAGYFLVISGYLRWEVRETLSRLIRAAETSFDQWRENRRRAKTMIEPRAYARRGGVSSVKDRSRSSGSKRTTGKSEPAAESSVESTGTSGVGAITMDQQAEVTTGDIEDIGERRSRWRQYKCPPLDLLADPPDEEVTDSREDLMVKAARLEEALATFKVTGKVVKISPGPVITLFEVEPGEGVRVNKFTVLADDLARIMSAERIRIIAPISGTKHVGVEIPNEKSAMVYLQSIISSDQFVKMRSPLTVALGKTTTGEAFCFDIAQMPHLLIAGTTGSGKSVTINTIITSMLYRAKPDEV
ncbi:MAG: DNA translocase FtsK 4TM domain-containing protein, partial [Candidatus Marinimicrobia bacterium]|nr:DNA translocase FtsK 4TM domain-containing protein [Candidatus Neomarinimicrobiota bacterium]